MTPFSLRNRLTTLANWTIIRRRSRIAGSLVAGVACVSIAMVSMAGVWSGWQASAPAGMQLSSIVPQGALLTIESKNFAGLLKQWNDSPEKSAWLNSSDYDVFSRSRLFSRLGDAQNEFAKSAGLPPDMSFLHEVSGTDSIFAWYDVGKLEFLYVTRMPSSDAEKTRLFAVRGKFTRRQIGTQTFYVRSVGGENASAPLEGDAADLEGAEPQQAGQESGGQKRTVAFATSGDWLLLATREDLMAGALTLLARSSAMTIDGAKDSLQPLSAEPWFMDAHAAAPKQPAELRMTLNLEKIVRTPYFRSYWIQQNVSEIKQYRSAVSDLYLKTGTGQGRVFREERVLLPKASSDEISSAPDLAELTALLPEHTGVYRAMAAASVEAAIGALDEKLLARAVGKYMDPRYAPDADVAVRPTGSSVDLETRIDAVPLAHAASGAELMALRQSLANADLRGMMTVSRTGTTTGYFAGSGGNGVWVPFESAVVLSSGKDWDRLAMQAALQSALGSHVTASGLGLKWKPVKTRTGTYFEISDTRPLEMTVRGKLLILSDAPELMIEMMGQVGTGAAERKRSGNEMKGTAMLIAGFDTEEERASFGRWTGLVDRNSPAYGTNGGNGQSTFFAGNMRSLGNVFADLQSERYVESRDGALIRQTVTYAWRR